MVLALLLADDLHGHEYPCHQVLRQVHFGKVSLAYQANQAIRAVDCRVFRHGGQREALPKMRRGSRRACLTIGFRGWLAIEPYRHSFVSALRYRLKI
jgi:hypothetical protein